MDQGGGAGPPGRALSAVLTIGTVDTGFNRATKCAYCSKLSPDNVKNKYCALCRIITYCGDACQTADWDEHKKDCKLDGETRLESIEELQELSLTRKQFLTESDVVVRWSWSIPGLGTEIELLAWEHRAKDPMFLIIINDTEISGNGISITMFTREDWEESETFAYHFVGRQRSFLNAFFNSKRSEHHFLCSFIIRTASTGELIMPSIMAINKLRTREYTVGGAALVLELTSAAPSLAALWRAFSWFKTYSGANLCEQIAVRLETIPNLQACGNELAFLILEQLELRFEIRLTGLQNQSHLNGKVGIVLGFNAKNLLRMFVSVNCTVISVLSKNMVRAPLGFKRKMSLVV
jgi:hypothetical protein